MNRSLRLGRYTAGERCRAASGLVGAERVLGLEKTVDLPVAEFEDWLGALAEHALPVLSEQLADGFGLRGAIVHVDTRVFSSGQLDPGGVVLLPGALFVQGSIGIPTHEEQVTASPQVDSHAAKGRWGSVVVDAEEAAILAVAQIVVQIKVDLVDNTPCGASKSVGQHLDAAGTCRRRPACL